MAKYMLARGQTRLPIDGIRTTQRPNDKPLRTTVTVLFHPGKPVESDLDFSAWVKEGVLIRLDVPPTLRPDPKPVAAPSMILPTPIPAQVEVIKEVPKAERPEQPADSHLATNPSLAQAETPIPMSLTPTAAAALDRAIESIKYDDEPAPVEAPKAVETKPVVEAPSVKVDASKQQPRGDNRNKRRR